MSKKFYDKNDKNLIGEVLATVLHKALEDNPDLLHRIFSEDGQISDDEIYDHLRRHNDSRLAQVKSFVQPQRQAPSAEPQDVRIVGPKRRHPFQEANGAARKLFSDGIDRLRSQK